MADTKKEPPPGGGFSNQPGPTNSTTSAWAGGMNRTGSYKRQQRTFAEIIAEEKVNRNILEIIMTKLPVSEEDGTISKFRNLTFDEIATFIFEVLKVSPSECKRFNYTTGRYDTREIMFAADIDISPYVGTFKFMHHEIQTRKQRSNVTKITFKNVPLNIPDEEILNLCETYGTPVDFVVHYEKLTNEKNSGHFGGTRYVDLELFPGTFLYNFYWMEGPLSGDAGRRITVLHAGQIQQCSNCLKLATQGCPGQGNGKACIALKTERTNMSTYMETIRQQHGYQSLKSKYYEQFPAIGGAGNFGANEILERNEDDEITSHTNAIEDKDKTISELQNALEESRKEISEVNALKDSLAKTKSELVIARKSSNLKCRKIEFARKITEQRMSNSLSNLSGDAEEELVNLYSTLVDEDTFDFKDEEIIPTDDFLKNVQDKLAVRGDIPEEHESLERFKSKILERVKQRKCNRAYNRRDSVSSIGSVNSKRCSSEQAGGDTSRKKVDHSSLPIPTKSL